MEGFVLADTEPVDMSNFPHLSLNYLRYEPRLKEVNEELVAFFSLHAYPETRS